MNGEDSGFGSESYLTVRTVQPSLEHHAVEPFQILGDDEASHI